MKSKAIIIFSAILFFYHLNCFAQDYPKNDDKLSVMNDIEKNNDESGPNRIKEWWNKQRKVEDLSFCFGYVTYGVPWGVQALHGVTIGGSLYHVMCEIDYGLGSMIDEKAYDNNDAFNVLKEKSTQSFISSCIQYYPIKSFSFGIGLRVHQELEKLTTSSITTNSNGYSIETDKTSFENNGFVDIRLVAKVYLPISSDKVSLYLSSGYDITPKNTIKNKFELGLGVKIIVF